MKLLIEELVVEDGLVELGVVSFLGNSADDHFLEGFPLFAHPQRVLKKVVLRHLLARLRGMILT